jgi:uncharacterized membrane protein
MKTLYTLLYLIALFVGAYAGTFKQDVYLEVSSYAFAIIFFITMQTSEIKEKIDKLNKNK